LSWIKPYTSIWRSCFAHIFPKSKFKEWKFLPVNILLVHPDIHHLLDNGTKDKLKEAIGERGLKILNNRKKKVLEYKLKQNKIMKIEIEFEEIEKLKKIIKNLEDVNTEVTRKLHSLDENRLKLEATKLAFRTTNLILGQIWKKLGLKGFKNFFLQESFMGSEIDLAEQFYKDFPSVDFNNVNIEIKQDIEDEWKGLFIEMGFIEQPNQI
jgi:hypothetical protein